MAKFAVGFSYTVWVEVDAKDDVAAIAKAVQIDYNLNCNELATVELNEFDDLIVHEVIEND